MKVHLGSICLRDAPTSAYREMIKNKRKYKPKERERKISAQCKKGKHGLMCYSLTCACECHEVK